MDQSFLQLKTLGLQIIKERDYFQPDNTKAFWLATKITFAFLLLFLVITYLPTAWAIPIGIALAIHLMNSVAQVSHFCGHNALFSNATVNRILFKISSATMGYGTDGHMLTHMDHHVYLNTDRDGDLALGSPKQTKAEFIKGIATDLLGLLAFRRILQYMKRKPQSVTATEKRSRASFILGVLTILAVQSLLYGVFYLAGGPFAYFIYWAIPACTLYPAQARLRSLAEHHLDQDRSDPWFARSTTSSFIENEIISPCGQNYHLEHHLFPNVPAYYLKSLHEEMKRRSDSIHLNPNRSYFGFALQFLNQGQAVRSHI